MRVSSLRRTVAVVGLLLASSGALRAEDAAPTPVPEATSDVVHLESGLRIASLGRGSRSLIHEDPIEARLVAGTWAPPKAGDRITAADGTERTWEAASADPKTHAYEGEDYTKGAYLSIRTTVERKEVFLLRASGHDFVYVNGELRPGDPYGYGWFSVPVLLHEGDNEFLFRVSRGRLTARLEIVLGQFEAHILPDDPTLPSCVPGAPQGGQGAALVLNPSLTETRVFLQGALGGKDYTSGAWASIPALSIRKVPLALPAVPEEAPTNGAAPLHLMVSGTSNDGCRQVLEIPWNRAGPRDPVLRHTFTSDIDGSVQYYATCGASRGADTPPRALVLSLHGASVEAEGQARSYAPKSWAAIVCPTNRRPYGFDWEAWGRLDALEVLGRELARGGYDRARVHVTGHSMGGHGSWHLGVTYPDLFATVSPSAGWISFGTYAGGPSGAAADPVEAMLRRASSPGDTLALATNLATKGVYVLHGDADDNVPVTEARTMVERLKGLVPDLAVHEQKGAGHWWDADGKEPGADCVDWAPMFDRMATRRLPSQQEVREVDFATASPGVSSKRAWVEIEDQEKAFVLSRVRVRLEPGQRRISGTTENVRVLVLDPEIGGERMTIALDGTAEVTIPTNSYGGPIRLAKRDGAWAREGIPDGLWKKPARYGPFQEAFRNRFLFVVGTKGTSAENAWAAAKARLDAESWWYRANGSVDIVEDVGLAEGLAPTPGRNVILYGHADMNAAWDAVLKACPVRVGRGELRVGERVEKGDDLACLFLWPRTDTYASSVGVVAGTGMPGLRLTERLPYLSSGVAVPDLVVLSTKMLSKGVEGLVGAGFFGPDWSVERGEFAWRDSPPR